MVISAALRECFLIFIYKCVANDISLVWASHAPLAEMKEALAGLDL